MDAVNSSECGVAVDCRVHELTCRSGQSELTARAGDMSSQAARVTRVVGSHTFLYTTPSLLHTPTVHYEVMAAPPGRKKGFDSHSYVATGSIIIIINTGLDGYFS